MNSITWWSITRELACSYIPRGGYLFVVSGEAANEFTVSLESVRIKCEYPQKLSTDVDKPVDNTIFYSLRVRIERETNERKKSKKNEQVFAV